MDPRRIRVIGLTIIPNQLNIIQNFLNSRIVIALHFPLQSSEVHRILDDGEIVGEAHTFPVYGLAEVEGVVGFVEAVYYYF